MYASGGFEPSGPIEGTDAVDAAVRERLGPATGHASVRLESGPPWGIAAVTLVGGIHLNNLSPVVRPGGYLDRYEDGTDSRDGSMLWHHGHGLGGRDTRFVEDADAMYLVKDDLAENNADDALETRYRFTPIQSHVTADQE